MPHQARLLAFYLPQFHPIPENDLWWGKGFTEWTNTARARPLYRGHYQPHIPADLGFYDLRVPETRQAQAALAEAHGIEGFCYYHYWFAGRRILERPMQDVLASGQPDFPFCVCWANETWTGIWHGAPNRILIEQTYPGPDDHRAHFDTLLPAFADRRHVRVDGKPLFLIFKPDKIPDVQATMDLWRDLAVKAGLSGLHIAGVSAIDAWNPLDYGLDAKIKVPYINARPWISRRRPFAWLQQKYAVFRGRPTIHSYEHLMADEPQINSEAYDAYPCVVHEWDNTPRSGQNGVVLSGASPANYRKVLERALAAVQSKPNDRRFVFLKSWNEWAEGNHLEPDLVTGNAYLEVVDSVFHRKDVRP